MKVYLAGGFYTKWQEKVKKAASSHEYFDPMVDADQRYPFMFTGQDLEGVKQSDIVFAYFERTNPSGLGLAKEVAWGVAFGKTIIFIDEHDRISSMLAACAKRTYTKLEPAIEYLKKLEGRADAKR